jgi:lipopolysaccharide biosynthesis protein
LKRTKSIISVFFHNYYGHDQEWASFFLHELKLPFHLFYNCVSDSFYRITQTGNIHTLYEQATFLQKLYVRDATNKGKDIGGKLLLMDAYLKSGIQSDYILLLHDKNSPYHSLGAQWKKDLFRIVQNEYIEKITSLFNNNPKTGIIASKNAIRNELDNELNSDAYIHSPLIQELKSKYQIQVSDLQFVAGTMFWVRAAIFENFFSTWSALNIRSELESGNIMDTEGPTRTHAWERLFCWLVTAKGYQIMGV